LDQKEDSFGVLYTSGAQFWDLGYFFQFGLGDTRAEKPENVLLD
jgi:hypothetical protein